MGALIGLLTATITFAVLGDPAHTGEALAAFIGFAAGSRASDRAAAAGALIMAGLAGIALSGCVAATTPQIVAGAEVVVDGLCVGAEKLCESNDPTCGSSACHAFNTACALLAPTAPVQLTCSRP